MTPFRLAPAAVAALVVAAAGWLAVDRYRAYREAAAKPASVASKATSAGSDGRAGEPTLYCEFYDFADRTPLVGFYFLIDEAKAPPNYALIFQREQDGAQADSGGETAPRPLWTLDGSDSPAVIRAPDDETRIDLYDYDPNKPGINWFEAGLRSIRYKNLGGKCRRSAT